MTLLKTKTRASGLLLLTMCFWSLSGQNKEAPLLGSWELIGWYDDIPRDINSDGNPSTDLFSQWEGCKKESILVLNKDGSGSIIYTGPNDNPKCPPGFQSGSRFNIPPWKAEERNLILSGSDHDEIYQIVELTASELVLKGSGIMTCCDPGISWFNGGYLKFRRK